MTIRHFEDIVAWRKARELTREIYKVTNRPNFARDYGLQNQMRRAATSIMSNIAEGFERDGNKEFRQFLSIAKGSAGEVKSQLYVALDAGFIERIEFDRLSQLATEIGSIIANFIRYLARTDIPGNKLREMPELYIVDNGTDQGSKNEGCIKQETRN